MGFQFAQVTPVKLIGLRDIFLIPAGIPGLIAPQEQNANPARIEGIEHTIGPAFMLYAQFAHIREAGALQRIRVGPLEVRALLLQKPDTVVDAVLLLGVECVPPTAELVGELNLPLYVEIMDWSAYFVKGAGWVRGLPPFAKYAKDGAPTFVGSQGCATRPSLDALTQKRGNIPRALGNGHNLDELILKAVENQVCAHRPEEDGISGKILALVTHSGVSGQFVKSVEELVDPAVGGCNVVLGDVLPDLVQVQIGAGAEDVRVHAMRLRRSLDFCSNRARAASGLTRSPRSKEANLAPSS